MSAPVAEEKARLRRQIKDRLNQLSTEERRRGSLLVCAQLAAHAVWRNARSVLLYAPTRNEPDVLALAEAALAQGKVVAFPRYRTGEDCYEARQVRRVPEDLGVGAFGIREPDDKNVLIALNQLDLVLVPGVGFDPIGRRLGRGKGYYDRLLATGCGLKCGLAFDCQVVAEIPAEPHDVTLDCIVTPTRWFGVTGRSESS